MDEEKTLHDCLDCEGCIFEEWCREEEKLLSGLLTEDEE